jgi:hypothetical protein
MVKTSEAYPFNAATIPERSECILIKKPDKMTFRSGEKPSSRNVDHKNIVILAIDLAKLLNAL